MLQWNYNDRLPNNGMDVYMDEYGDDECNDDDDDE